MSAVFVVGCATARPYPAPPALPPQKLVETNDQAVVGGTAACTVPCLPNVRASRNVLVLSGGGMFGAYTAGVLKGWTESGYRPQFDVVTGISTGSLVAPYAFLGPQYDTEVEQLYTTIHQDNIFHPRLVWLDSLASTAPLEQLIKTKVTPEILRQIAEAHRQGRRLYVGTTNLDTKRIVVWDMGAIACRGSAESASLFQKVLLASCSVPGLFPPVAIDVDIDGKRYTELHVDGSVIANFFLQPSMVGVGPSGIVHPDPRPVSIHVIVAGKLRHESAPAQRELFSIAGKSLDALFQAKTEDELAQTFFLARYVNARFMATAVPEDYPVTGNAVSFDPEVMRGLFDLGYRGGKDGTAWRATPPELDPDEFVPPRAGTSFATMGKAGLAQPWPREDPRFASGSGTSPDQR